ncbi:MAG: ABC transporter permease, partial [Lachnospirales bacterium]
MKNFKSMVFPYILWSVIMILIPMFLILIYAFTKEGNSVKTIAFTLENFEKFFSDKLFLEVLIRSIYIAALTTIICVLLGYPAAYFIAKLKIKSQVFMILLVTFPTWINMLVRTYAWRGIMDKNGIINIIITSLGFEPLQMLETSFAVVLGMVYNFIPFMILQIYNSLSKMDQSFLEAAADLGANKYTAFFKVTLPLSVPGIVSGITLVFLPAVSSFFIPKLLGGGQYVLIGNLIENPFLTAGD